MVDLNELVKTLRDVRAVWHESLLGVWPNIPTFEIQFNVDDRHSEYSYKENGSVLKISALAWCSNLPKACQGGVSDLITGHASIEFGPNELVEFDQSLEGVLDTVFTKINKNLQDSAHNWVRIRKALEE
jgi:hypothetical protein